MPAKKRLPAPGPGRIALTNPDPKQRGPDSEREKYEISRRTILGIVSKQAPGVTWTVLRDTSDRALGKKLRGGNNWWYTTAVKLHREAIGKLKRSGAMPQRLRRT